MALLTNVFTLFLALITAPLFSQEAYPKFNYGQVKIENSGSADAQEVFLQGLAALHSFEYLEAILDFRAAQEIDPDFALAYWGEAMANNHAFWRVQNYTEARKIMDRLGATAEERLSKAKLDFEKDLIASLELLFGEGSKQERDEAYCDFMQQVYEKYPDNVEALTDYALAILGTIQPTDTSYRKHLKAAGLIDAALGYQPNEALLNHPGVLHYFIHALDDPIHAPLALKAADRYALVVPDAPHALHMPAHIYHQTGLWDKSHKSNTDAYEASIRWVDQRTKKLSDRDYHSFYWLSYACAQLGRYAEAKEKIDDIIRFKAQDPVCATEGHWALMIARYMIETGDCFYPFSEEEMKTIPTCRVSDEPQAYSFAYAMGACAIKNKNFSQADIASGVLKGHLEDIEKMIASNEKPHEIEEQRFRQRLLVISLDELAALKEHANGNLEKAISFAKKAADEEMLSPFPNGLPIPVQPALQLYGNLLLENRQWKEALEIFTLAKERLINRPKIYLGMAQAYAGLGNQKQAARYAKEALKIWHTPDTEFPELEAARKLAGL